MTRAHQHDTITIPGQTPRRTSSLTVVLGDGPQPPARRRQPSAAPRQSEESPSSRRGERRHRLAAAAAETDALASWTRGTTLSVHDYELILSHLVVDYWKLFGHLTASSDALIRANQRPFELAAKLGYSFDDYERRRTEIHRVVMLHVNSLCGRGPGLPSSKRAGIPAQRTS